MGILQEFIPRGNLVPQTPSLGMIQLWIQLEVPPKIWEGALGIEDLRFAALHSAFLGLSNQSCFHTELIPPFSLPPKKQLLPELTN